MNVYNHNRIIFIACAVHRFHFIFSSFFSPYIRRCQTKALFFIFSHSSFSFVIRFMHCSFSFHFLSWFPSDYVIVYCSVRYAWKYFGCVVCRCYVVRVALFAVANNLCVFLSLQLFRAISTYYIWLYKSVQIIIIWYEFHLNCFLFFVFDFSFICSRHFE